MLKKISYDQIYDAHVFMFSVLSVQKIFNNFDLFICLWFRGRTC